MTAPLPWTADLKAETCRRWNLGHSAGEIAKHIGRPFTRNAVIGVIHRAGLSRPVGTIMHTARGTWVRGEQKPRVRQQCPIKPKPLAPPKPQPVVVARHAAVVVSLDHARPWLERASRECAYLLDDGRSCCAAVESGSYCAGHRAIMYRPTAKLGVEKMARKFG